MITSLAVLADRLREHGFKVCAIVVGGETPHISLKSNIPAAAVHVDFAYDDQLGPIFGIPSSPSPFQARIPIPHQHGEVAYFESFDDLLQTLTPIAYRQPICA